ncbi:MAG: hypothetical protein HOC79_04570 [Euryarchaeota archaeon]|jgi:hypothetical protein|nr:hypothetical protein [Euryarchaeota archaeon]MBT4407127.1 hypothetical protein [Euryarchaeota archaeon]
MGITLLFSYSIWVATDCDPIFPFISDLDLHPMSTILFTAGLTLTGIMVIILAFQITNNRKGWCETLHTNEFGLLPMINNISFFPGIIVGLGIIGIAWNPWNEGIEIHILYANAIFYGGVAWTFLATYSTWLMCAFDERFKQLIKPRIFAAVTAAVCLLILIWKVGQAHNNGFDFGENEALSRNFVSFCKGNAGGSLDDIYLSQAAIAEWVMVLSMLYFSNTFAKEVTIINEAMPQIENEE